MLPVLLSLSTSSGCPRQFTMIFGANFVVFLPALLFISAAITELVLCVYALHSGRIKLAGVLVLLVSRYIKSQKFSDTQAQFQNIGSQRMIRDGTPMPISSIPFGSQLQNISFGTLSCCLGFANGTKCQPMPVYLPAFDFAFQLPTKLQDIHALKAISSGLVRLSLSWVVVLTCLLVVAVSLVLGCQHVKFLSTFRKVGNSLKVVVIFLNLALGSLLILPLLCAKQVSWEMRKVVGVTVLDGQATDIMFGALCCFIVMTFCATFICTWSL